jgi:transposase, IS30 family
MAVRNPSVVATPRVFQEAEVVQVPGPRLCSEERRFISVGRQDGLSIRQIACELGRAPSTVSREVRRNRCSIGYQWRIAHYRAGQRARRPKAFKLERHPRLARWVARLLRKNWSPEQIAARLRAEHLDDPRWWVSPEAIYKALYVQGRGGLRDELTRHLRKGRPRRKNGPEKRGRIPDMVNIAVRPPEADDRAVPGHWEGDLLVGKDSKSQVGMVTERSTRLTLLFELEDRTAPTVARALAKKISKLPLEMKRSLALDQGKEFAAHVSFTVDTGVQIYFCDPGSPWQRGTAENTVGLLRQYLPKNEDLSRFSQRQLDAIAAELNDRPRKTLGWLKPVEAYSRLVSVATTD